MSTFKLPSAFFLVTALASGCIIETDSDDADTDDPSAGSSDSTSDASGSSTGDIAESTGADESSSGGSTTTGGPAPTSDCTPYEPSEAGEMLGGSWPADQEEVEFTLTAPDDPGGGFVRVELRSGNVETVPFLSVTAGGDTAGAVLASSAAGTADPTVKYAAFAVEPGVTYTLRTSGSGGDAFPVDFDLSWTFTSLVDCWEPNDTPDAAAQAVLGETLDAHAHSGYETNQIFATEFSDWYSVTLDAPGGLRAALDVPPDGHRMRVHLYADPEAPPLETVGGSAPGEQLTAEEADLDPGTYLVHVEVADAEGQTQVDEDSDPSSWTTPYALRLETF